MATTEKSTEAIRRVVLACLVWASLPIRASSVEDHVSLREALRLHVSFDESLSADLAVGDPDLREFSSRREREAGGRRAELREGLQIQLNAGRFGGAMYRGSEHDARLFFPSADVLGWDGPTFSGTVSLWLRTNPDEDIPRAFCDPVMFIPDNYRDGLIFIEWSKDHTPREFRFAIMPEFARWNPDDREWESIPDDERPMVQISDRPFGRDRWVHVVFTFDQINAGEVARGALFVDGELRGKIEGWDLTVAWNPASVIMAVAWNYVGWMDDLAVFDRALSAEEIALLHTLPGGVGDLSGEEVQ